MTLVPIPAFEKAPPRIDQEEGVEKPERVDLREIPIGTVIEFFGEHQDSKYLMVLVQNESERQVKIWLKGRGN